MSPEVLQLVYTVFINTINMVSTFWSGIKQNKKKKKTHWVKQKQLAGLCLWVMGALLLSFILESENHEIWPRSALLDRWLSVQKI